jgi:hypothetical protein
MNVLGVKEAGRNLRDRVISEDDDHLSSLHNTSAMNSLAMSRQSTETSARRS